MFSILKTDLKQYYLIKKLKLPNNLKEVVNFKNFNELEKKLNKKDIIITTYFNYNNKNLNKLIKKYDLTVIDIAKAGLEKYFFWKSKIDNKEESFLKKIFYKIYLNEKIRMIYFYFFYKNKPTYILTPKYLKFNAAKKYIPIHNIKYDEYLKIKKEKPLINHKYAVFLDSNLPYLNDILMIGEKSVKAKKYFYLLNKLFDLIEKKYNIKVIIAPHPKSNYTKKTFNGRKMIKYKTANLIHNSEFVVSHDTTSNANAVLSKKPIIFIYNDEMLKTGAKIWALRTMQWAKELNAPLINLEKNLNFKLNVDHKKYDKFINKYIICEEKKHLTNAEIIIDFLKKL